MEGIVTILSVPTRGFAEAGGKRGIWVEQIFLIMACALSVFFSQ